MQPAPTSIQDATRDWPAHRYEVRPYRQRSPRGASQDRRLSEIRISLPPMIAELDYPMPPELTAMTTASLGELSSLDLMYGRSLDGLNPLQLRTEAIDSSKIEDIEASLADYGRALHGTGSSASAQSMVQATRAMSGLISTAARSRRITVADLLAAHRELFRRTASEGNRPGEFRTTQNWVGGSDYSPRNPLHVPPPPETVEDYLTDLIAFTDRDDLPILAQAAIAHAQFESIHPFIDGNGRIGRALIHAVFRRRRATKHLVVPIASALVSHREAYFAALGDYRAGNAHTIVAMMASATHVAVTQARRTAGLLTTVREGWGDALGGTRPGTPVHRLLDLALEEPILNLDVVAEVIGLPAEISRHAVGELLEAGILTQVRRTRRSPVWLAPDVLTEVDALRRRIREASIEVKGRA